MSIVLLKDNKLFFNHRSVYDNQDNKFHVPDLTKTVYSAGWFIPTVIHGMQAAYWLDENYPIFPASEDVTNVFSGNMGVLGLLVTLNKDESIGYHELMVNNKRHFIPTPLIQGQHGHAVLAEHDHLAELMSACVLLKNNIEDIVALYYKRTAGDASAACIWNEDQIRHHIKTYRRSVK